MGSLWDFDMGRIVRVCRERVGVCWIILYIYLFVCLYDQRLSYDVCDSR